MTTYLNIEIKLNIQNYERFLVPYSNEILHACLLKKFAIPVELFSIINLYYGIFSFLDKICEKYLKDKKIVNNSFSFEFYVIMNKTNFLNLIGIEKDEFLYCAWNKKETIFVFDFENIL
jgi:hypothetical protein